MSVSEATCATELRVVWEHGCCRLVALRQGEDLEQPDLFHYEAMIQRDGLWQWCGDSREEQAVLRSVAAWLDALP